MNLADVGFTEEPTIENLIAACGDRFMQLEYFPKSGLFMAGGREPEDAQHKSIRPVPYVKGTTAQEAMERLLIAIRTHE